MQHHPHIHCVIPAGRLSLYSVALGAAETARFFLSIRVLSRVFRGKFCHGLNRLFRSRQLQFHGALRNLVSPKLFRPFLRSLFRQDWVVYSKRPFGGPEHVLQYLARYTHRVAISDHRLLAFADNNVTFRWKDYAHGSKQRKMTLTAHEFLCRFLLHVLPSGFVRIRHFGLFANRDRRKHASLCRRFLGTIASTCFRSAEDKPTAIVRWLCPLCGGNMEPIEQLTSQQLAYAVASWNRRVDGS